MLRLLVRFILPTFLLLQPCCLWAGEVLKLLRAEIDIQGSTSPIEYFITCDCNGDGWEEMLAWGHPQTGTTDVLQMWAFDGALFIPERQWPFHDGRIFNCMVSDLDGDGSPEILLARSNGREVWLDVLGSETPGVVASSPRMPVPDLDGGGSWDGHFQLRAVTDVDGDNISDIICSCAAGYDLDPRGITVHSGATLELLGTFDTAGPVHRVKAYRGENLSETVILVEAGAASNGKVVGPFDDYHMYLYALNNSLDLIWYVPVGIGGTLWDFDLVDVSDDGLPEVIVGRELPRGSEAEDYVMEARDLMTGKVKRCRPVRRNLGTIIAEDLDWDLLPELIVTIADGTLEVLDRSFQPLYTHKEDAILHTFLVEDLDLDGEVEIVVRRGNVALMVFTPDLEVRASRDFGSQIRQAGVTRVNQDRAYLHASVVSGKELKHLRLVADKPARGFFVVLAAGTALMILSLRWGLKGIRIKRDRPDPEPIGNENPRSRSELLALLSGFSHSGIVLENLGRLAQYCENRVDPSSERYGKFRSELGSIIETYRDFTQSQLRQIAEHCAGMDGHQGVEGFREEILDMASVMKPMDRHRLPCDYGEETEKRIAERARTILDRAKAIRQQLIVSQHADVPAVLCLVVAAVRERALQYGVNRIELALEGGGYAHVDEDALKQCLEIVIVNAVEAMAESTPRDLQLKLAGADSRVKVSVRDTGCGISKERWKKIFERGETTKEEGRGLGLAYARELLSPFGGRICVEWSQLGQGTVMVIELRAVGEGSPVTAGKTRETTHA